MINDRKSVCTTHSAITVVSAFASGKGAAIGIAIPCKISAEISYIASSKAHSNIEVIGKISDPHGLVRKSVTHTLDYLKITIPDSHALRIQIDSKIPVAVGLKSSSAVSVGVVKSILDLFAENKGSNGSLKILRLSCEASKLSGASLTGAFDDAAAGLLGGLVLSDNTKFKLLAHVPVDESVGSIVKILVPKSRKKLTSSLNLPMYQKYEKMSLEAFKFAMKGVLVQAMLMNSIIHSIIHHYTMQPVISSVLEGATASGISGKGPSVAAICRSSKIANRVAHRWLDENENCNIITSSIRQQSFGI